MFVTVNLFIQFFAKLHLCLFPYMNILCKVLLARLGTTFGLCFTLCKMRLQVIRIKQIRVYKAFGTSHSTKSVLLNVTCYPEYFRQRRWPPPLCFFCMSITNSKLCVRVRVHVCKNLCKFSEKPLVWLKLYR